ncbi:hypothetical protein KFL_012450010, partial [Klebsormidium nitens]
MLGHFGRLGQVSGASKEPRVSASGTSLPPLPLEEAAPLLIESGYAVFTARLETYRTEKGEEKKRFLPSVSSWQTLTPENSKEYLATGPSKNALSINCGNSDVVVVDIDLKGGGMETWQQLERVHGVSSGFRCETGTKGLHLFFKLSSSVAVGLESGSERPTTWAGLEWLIKLVNRRNTPRSVRPPSLVLPASPATSVPAAATALYAPELMDEDLLKRVVAAQREMLTTWGDSTSTFSKATISRDGTGVMYDYKTGPGGRRCPYLNQCDAPHVSNHFGLLRRGLSNTYYCYSSECADRHKQGGTRKDIGKLDFPLAAAFSDARPLHADRSELYRDRTLLPHNFLRRNLSTLA